MRKPHSLVLKYFVYITEWLSYSISNAIILTSEIDKQFVINTFKVKHNNKIKVIPNYIDTVAFEHSNNIGKKKSHLLFVGRLSKEKNLLNLFEAIKGSKYILDIIGDGELKEEMKDYSLKNKINVNFLGRVPNNEMPEFMNKYEVFILPSLYEGNPKALLEAMSCGLAIIGTDVEGINNIIKHKENGYLCKTDSKSIRDAIDIVMRDDELRKQLGKNARQFIINHHAIDEIVKKEIDGYSTLL